MITFRDDDIGPLTKLEDFKKVHSLFELYGVMHTVALITNRLEENIELVEYINKASYIDVQLHCWDHIQFTSNHEIAASDLQRGIDKIVSLFGVQPTVFYPTWNMVDDKIIKIAADLGLKTSYEKISLSQYIRTKGDVKERVINFHYWAYDDAMLIEPALKIYTSR